MKYTSVNHALPELALQLQKAPTVDSRAGQTKELTFVQTTIERPWNREVLVPGRKASLPAQIAETVWVLSGRRDVEWLSHYLPRAKEFSDDGKVWRAGYGPRLRRWGGKKDQVAQVTRLLTEDPNTRQAVIAIWDPAEDLGAESKDIPCNNWLHFIKRQGRLHLHVAIRSNDLIWGWSGINQFQWSALLEIVANYAGIPCGTITYSTTSLHVYERHWKMLDGLATFVPNVFDQNSEWDYNRLPDSPRFDNKGYGLDGILGRFFEIEELIRTGSPVDLSLVDRFPEPMLKSWLQVLMAHWSGRDIPEGLERLQRAFDLSPQRATEVVEDPSERDKFTRYVTDLHASKHAAYGDSWCRRGESIGILANIARKVDRLGKTDDHETATDTAIDLLVYLLKYRNWLLGSPLGEVEAVDTALMWLRDNHDGEGGKDAIPFLQETYELMWTRVDKDSDADKFYRVDKAVNLAYALAWWEWSK